MRRFLSNMSRYGTTAALILMVLLMLQSAVFAQQSGVITGSVLDTTGAVVPNAKVALINQATKDQRQTVSNRDGFFSFPGVTAGDYSIRVEYQGFRPFELKGVHVLPGDKQYLSQIKLSVAAANTSVDVEANSAEVLTVNSAERSSTITSEDMKRLGTDGRNATELVKTLPGFTVRGANKVDNRPGYDPNVQSIFNSATLGYGANGMAPQTGGVGLTSDGAQIIDPGDMGASTATINMDMVEEVKVQTSNFGADTAKGPIVISAVGKSGSERYHGSAYLYARDGSMNSWDSYLKANKTPNQEKTADRYLYPGGNIGGPVNIPGTNLKEKMFFFSGFEYYKQNIPFNNPISAQVPTDGMRNGDFSWNGVKSICESQMPQGWRPGQDWTDTNGNVHHQTLDVQNAGPLYCQTPNVWINPVTQTAGWITNGNIAAYMDPGGRAYLKLFPKANATPTSANGYSNYIYQPVVDQNSWQLKNRVDYNFNQNNKLYGSHNLQKEVDPVTQAMYWAPGSAIPYPGGVEQRMKSSTFSLNYLRVFSPTLTNEAKATLVSFNAPFNMNNPEAVSRKALGYSYTGVLANGNDQMPALINWWPGGFPMVYMQGGFDNGPLLSRKTSYTFQDDVSKVYRTHTIKAGFYYEHTANGQWLSSNTNGTLDGLADTWRYVWTGPTGNLTGWHDCGGDGQGNNPACFNNVANLMMGLVPTYKQDQKALSSNMYFKTMSFYGTDSWKVTRRLTLDFGARVEYLGPWTDSRGIGLAVFDKGLYAKQASQSINSGWYQTTATAQYPGMKWHAMDSSVPLSGAAHHAPFVSPRFGLTYDIFGDGKTVLRGGWGQYRWHDSYNAYAGALNPGLGQKTVNLSGTYSLAMFDNMASQFKSGQLFGDGSANFVDAADKQQPLTTNWNMTITRQMPWNSVLEVGYVGNESTNMIPPGTLTSINVIPIGGLYTKDLPNDSNTIKGQISNLSANQMDQYRPYSWYNVNLQGTTHHGWANYHAMQVSWNRQKGWATVGLNYTFSKALGLFTDANPTNIHDNYGPLGFDRTHAINASYSFDVGKRYHGNSLLEAIVNNWMFSGITSWQSGFSIQSANDANTTNFSFGGARILNPNYDPTAPITDPNASLYMVDLNNKNVLGTPDVTLQPYFACDPTEGAKGANNSYMNTSCWQVPQFLKNGGVYKGYFHSPAYFTSDLTVSKTFILGEKKRLQIRASGFNFLNHPLLSFNESNKNNISLGLTSSATQGYCPVQPGVDANGNPHGQQYDCFKPGQTLIPMDFAQNVNAKNAGYIGQATTKFGRRTIMLGVKFEF